MLELPKFGHMATSIIQFESRDKILSRVIFSLDVLWVRYNCAKFHHCRICGTDFREGGQRSAQPPPASSVSIPEKTHPE